jgi:hypothetical protein
MLIASLALTSDLIGKNTVLKTFIKLFSHRNCLLLFFFFKASAAFVFGTMSFFDKIINGAFVLILEQINPNKNDSSNENQEINTKLDQNPIKYYQQIIVFVSGSAVILTFLGVLSIARTNLNNSEELEGNNDINQIESNQSNLKL